MLQWEDWCYVPKAFKTAVHTIIQLQSEKATINLDATFTPPIFKWDGIPARFFEMLYESLNQRFTIAPQELQVSSGNTFGDTVAKYKILNGNNTISLSVKKFSAEFPMALRNDYPVIQQTLLVAGAGFSAKFPEYQITQVHGAGSEHAVLVSDVSVTDYLSQFEVPEVNATVDSISTS
ncbi:MAG: hypothetical protein OXG56_12185 [Gammaproteobacteria bacterium]|nr:hypothetical protein [Gammaproteobacteria bacterium]